MRLSHEQSESLLGAYALHAVEPDEAEAIDRHVEECPRCRAELAGYLKAAPLLASAGPQPFPEPPPGLWEEVAAGIESPAGPPLTLRPATRPALVRQRPRFATLSAAAAVFLALVTAVAVLAVKNGSSPTRSASQQLSEAAATALADPHDRTMSLVSSSGGEWAKVVVAPGGAAYLVSSAFPTLAPGRTYQLWALRDGKPVSLGVLGRRPQVDAFRVEGGTTVVMVTAEPAGGVPQPDSPVLATAVLA